jgi:hypothetical protein
MCSCSRCELWDFRMCLGRLTREGSVLQPPATTNWRCLSSVEGVAANKVLMIMGSVLRRELQIS